jgi:hypothetical protein
MAFVDDDEVEEIGRVFAEVGRRMAVPRRPAHEGLEDGEEDASVLGNLALFADVLRADADQGVFGEGGERGEIVEGLRGEVVAVCQEEDARAAGWFGVCFPIRQVPAGFKEFPGDLEGDGGFAGAGCKR